MRRQSVLSSVLDSSTEFRDNLNEIHKMNDIVDIIPEHTAPTGSNFENIFGYYERAITFINQIVVVCIILHHLFGNKIPNGIIVYKDTHEAEMLNYKLMELENSFFLLIKTLNDSHIWRVKNPSLPTSVNCGSVDIKIREALDLYDADKLGMIDYALASGGASVVSTPNTTAYPSKYSYSFFGLINIKLDSNPRLLIQPGTFAGQCFAFFGSTGRIRIKLSNTVQITAVTLEHISKNLTDNIGSSPKRFAVHGFKSEEYVGNNLGEFTYNIQGKSLQTFPILKNAYKKYNYVELEILTNYGNKEYTCVYRFRVHGLKA